MLGISCGCVRKHALRMEMTRVVQWIACSIPCHIPAITEQEGSQPPGEKWDWDVVFFWSFLSTVTTSYIERDFCQRWFFHRASGLSELAFDRYTSDSMFLQVAGSYGKSRMIPRRSLRKEWFELDRSRIEVGVVKRCWRDRSDRRGFPNRVMNRQRRRAKDTKERRRWFGKMWWFVLCNATVYQHGVSYGFLASRLTAVHSLFLRILLL